MTAPEPGAGLDGPIGPPEDRSAPTSLSLAMAAVDLVCDVLAMEVAVLDGDQDGSSAPAASTRRLLVRNLHGVCSRLAPHIAELPPEDVARVLDHLFSRTPFVDQRMRTWTPRLRAHLEKYAASLVRWSAWDARTVDLDEDVEGVAVRWGTVWVRPDDGAAAADFVGYVNDPADLARPGRDFAVFLRDAQAVLGWLEGEYGQNLRGLRLWIVGADGCTVVRWLSPE